MDTKPALPSHSSTYDGKMKEVLRNLRISKNILTFLILTLIVNAFLTYGLIFYPPRLPPTVESCAEHIKAQCGSGQLLLPPQARTAGSTIPSLPNDVLEVVDIETTALSLRSTGKSSLSNQHLRICTILMNDQGR